MSAKLLSIAEADRFWENRERIEEFDDQASSNQAAIGRALVVQDKVKIMLFF